MKVITTKGLIEIDDLIVKDTIEMYDNARVFATEWYFNDELVRRDVNVNVLRGLSAGAEQSEI